MLLDGASLWFRAFHALPEKMTAPDGRPVNAVRGFVDMIASLVTREHATRLVVCLDLDWRPAFRTDLIPSYKAHRVAEEATDGSEEVPDTLTPQVEMIMKVLAAAGIATAGAEGCEADDVLGTLADGETTDPVIVVSGDRDLLQVVADDPVPVRVLYVGRGLAKAEMFGPADVAERYDLPTDNPGSAYVEMAILRGDPSDGLPGVAGIGEKTASKLLHEFGNLDELQRSASTTTDKRISPRQRKSLADAAEYLSAARTVVCVRTDADIIGLDDDRLPSEPTDPVALADLIEELGIGASVGRLGKALGWTVG